MEATEFEELLVKADLHPSLASPSHGVAFLVSLHAPTQFGTRIQCDWLTYHPAEFAMMSRIEAEREIAQCIARLQKAAKTKQGTLPKARITA